ncbi:hypothetical protein WICMUC_000762 [Wickerhamomyces mucosus]|uniref:Phosphatidic acid phosphatase type 2/haloperoxidase domain-containing protein n=1 Tax=Wickerhamomyces mucosus TaxID=1378264 RepID=A0A9P8TIL4_9ASCO|nr:hypothetical protein WICMUC_000762 [Wickerhamomyces mucosus]
METILYGDNLSELLAASTNSILDILAWLPYGLIHFALPFIVAILLFLWGPPTCLRSFAFAFGYMNLFGVIIQLLFPAAPPWYKILHGLNPANYSMLGSPGGLARIDQLLHLDLYTTNFSKNSPVVFGAFPSLHSGSATMDALFLSYLFPKFTPLFIIYVCWLWWSTMYLTHHYFIDLMAGSLLSLIVFTYTKYIHLPINEELKNRWSYVEIKKINIFKLDPLKLSLDDEIDNNNNINRGSSRLRSGSIQQYQYELNIISRTSNNNDDTIINNNDDDGVSSPENSSVFENDIPRSFSRASNTSLESQYDLGTYPSKSRID